jgi:transposase-like protein
MSKKRKTYKPEVKAQIVLEILREDSTLNEIAQKHGVSQQLISRCSRQVKMNTFC